MPEMSFADRCLSNAWDEAQAENESRRRAAVFDKAAEAAARRVWHVGSERMPWTTAVAAAREALKPIREWFELVEVNAIAEDRHDQIDLLESLAPLIYDKPEVP